MKWTNPVSLASAMAGVLLLWTACDTTVDCEDGYEPVGDECVDIDECLTDNGGCGDALYWDCLNNEGAEPTCEDVDECLTDNGGCGDPEVFICTNVEGGPPLCSYDPAKDYQTLTEGVEFIDSEDSWPGSMVVHGDTAFPVILDEGHLSVVAAARVESGRAVVLGHETHLGGALSNSGDTDQLMLNAVGWSSATEAPVVGVESGLTQLSSFLSDNGHTVQTATPADLDSVDVFFTTTYTEHDEEDFEQIRSFLRNGGGLIAAGHAWYWAYSNEVVAVNYPGNKMLAEAGITISTGFTDGGTDQVGDEHPSDLFHASKALDLILEHLSEEAPLDFEDQVYAADTVALAIDTLPLDFEYFDRAQVISETEPVIPSPSSPVTPATMPIESLVVHLDAKFALELPVDELFAHPAADDFPGVVPEDAETVTVTMDLDGSYEGRDSRYGYSGAGAAVWRSTGLYAPPGEVLTVTISEAATGHGLDALIGCHTDTLWSTESWERSPQITRAYDLDSAETSIASMFGGLIYIRVPGETDAGTVPVTIDGAIHAPFYDHGTTTLDEWQNTQRDHPAPWAELHTDRFVITVPSDEVRTLDDPQSLMAFWDQVLDADAVLAAIDTDRVRAERIVTDRQISAGWMHSGYPIMAQLASAPDIVEFAHLQANGDWGVFHELGHNHQWMDWLLPGTTEASVNLWSVYVYEEVLGISRDDAHSALAPNDRQARIEDYLDGGADFWNDWNVWTALETYLQLQEVFGWGLYQDLFAEYLEIPAAQSPSDDQERIDEWVLRSSLAAGADLGPFYLAWGFPVSQGVLDEIALLPPWNDDPMTP